MRRLLILLTLMLLPAVGAVAGPAVSCHCFQERSFDPQRPAAADPYILATTQNTLLAAALGLPKKEVVRAKMAGENGDRLWVVHYLAAHSGLPSEKISAARLQADDWRGAVQLLRLDPGAFSPLFVAALVRQADERLLAAAAADASLIDFCSIEPETTAALRQAGASTAETVLAVLLARKAGRASVQLLALVRNGRATWGSLLQAAAVSPAEIDTLFPRPMPGSAEPAFPD